MGMIFSAYDIRGKGGEAGATEYMWNVGKAFAEWLPDTGEVLLVRSDSAADTVVHAVTEGLLLQGRNVIDGGVDGNGAIINAINEKKAVGGALIDHNDLQALDIITLYDGRGINVTADNGLGEIRDLVDAGNFVPAGTKGEVKKPS